MPFSIDANLVAIRKHTPEMKTTSKNSFRAILNLSHGYILCTCAAQVNYWKWQERYQKKKNAIRKSILNC